MAGHGFRQDIVFFVDGLPPTSSPLDAGADDSAVQPLLTGGAASDRWPTERVAIAGNRMEILLISLVRKRRYSKHKMAGFFSGSATALALR